MGGKSTPDFGDVAASQGENNEQVVRDQLYANRPDQYTPWGYNKWTTEQMPDGTDRWTQTQGLKTEYQDILDKQTAIAAAKSDVAGGLMGRMQSEFGAPADWRGLSPMGQVPGAQFTLPEPDVGDPNQYRQHAEDAMYNQAQSRLQPQQDSARQALEIKLRNQGLGPQDAAWQTAMQGQGNQFNDANNQAMWSSVGEGRNEANQMFGQMMGRQSQNYQQALGANNQNFNQMTQQSNMANQIRQQQLTEQMQKRGHSLNEINALLSGGQVGMPQMPNFSGGQAATPAPIYQGAADAASVGSASISASSSSSAIFMEAFFSTR